MNYARLAIVVLFSLLLFGCGDPAPRMTNKQIVDTVAFCHAAGMNTYERLSPWDGRIEDIQCVPNDLDLKHNPIYHPGECAFCTHKDDHV